MTTRGHAVKEERSKYTIHISTTTTPRLPEESDKVQCSYHVRALKLRGGVRDTPAARFYACILLERYTRYEGE